MELALQCHLDVPTGVPLGGDAGRSPTPAHSVRRSRMATVAEVMAQLQAKASPENVAGMARFGMTPDRRLGVSVS